MTLELPPMPPLMRPLPELHEEQARLDPFAYFRSMRQSQPVRYSEEREIWDVFGYSDVAAVLKDTTRFSSVAPEKNPLTLGSLMALDPPDHTKMRHLVSSAFTPKAVEEMQPRIAVLVDNLLERAVQQGTMEVVSDLAFPLPVYVIADMMGIPHEDHAKFKEWMRIMFSVPPQDKLEQGMLEKFQTSQEMDVYFGHIMEQRRAEPRQDLISALIAAEVEGDRLTEEQIRDFCELLLAGGHETTANLIASSVRCMLELPELAKSLRAHPEQIDAFLEEVLRYYPPVLTTVRYALQDVELGGRLLRQGDAIAAWIGSANRDESIFEAADQFRTERFSKKGTPPHLSFGSGAHFCLGSTLARMEARHALSGLLKRCGDFTRADDHPLIPHQSHITYGVKALRIRY